MAILVETNITITEEQVEKFLQELTLLNKEITVIPGGIPHRWTENVIAAEENYVVLQAAAGAPAFTGANYLILSYWEKADQAAQWEKSSFHQKLAEIGTVEIRKYQQTAEPGQRQGLHENRMQRDYFFNPAD